MPFTRYLGGILCLSMIDPLSMQKTSVQLVVNGHICWIIMEI